MRTLGMWLIKRKRVFAGMVIACLTCVIASVPRVAPRDNPVTALWALAADDSGWGTRVNAGVSESILEEIDVGDLSTANMTWTVKVALIDTGVDPDAIPGASISDWVDLTGEGVVSMSEPIKVSAGGTIHYAGRDFDVRGVKTRSGYVRIGFFRPQDSLAHGSRCESFFRSVTGLAVLLSDTYLAKRYDTAYVDTNGNDKFGDETGIGVFRNGRGTAHVTGVEPGVTFTIVLCDIFDNGETISLGFDGHGHGTAAASILAGREPSLKGVAPLANLVVIKAVDSSGRTNSETLSNAILRAVKQKVNVIILSVGEVNSKERTDEIVAAIEEARKANIAVILPAGNRGPGLSTISRYAELENVVTVGGYIPRSVAEELGWDTDAKVWPWSSIGPTTNGATVTVLAPALAPSLLPCWASKADKTRLFEGTSCAAAFTGGCAAILFQEALTGNKPATAVQIKKALTEGARQLSDVIPVEQGYGLVDVKNSVKALKVIDSGVKVQAVYKWDNDFKVGGFFDREKVPGYIPLSIDNLSPVFVRLRLTTPDWMKVAGDQLSIPAVEYNWTSLSVADALKPGLYSGWLTGDDPSLPGKELMCLVTAIRPKELGESALRTQEILRPGQIHREYVKIPDGLESISAVVQVPQNAAGVARGRIDVFLYDSQVDAVYESGWIGSGAGTSRGDVTVKFPRGGVWEIDVVSDPASSLYGINEGAFDLEVYAEGLMPTDLTGEMSLDDTQSQVQSVELRMKNTGSAFPCETLVLVPGENGAVDQELMTVTGASSVAKPLPNVMEGCKYLYISVGNPRDAGVDLDVYVYYFDKSKAKWIEVAAGNTKASGGEEVVVDNPMPGQYVAYVEASGLTGESSTDFVWTCVTARALDEPGLSQSVRSETGFLWKEKSEATLKASVSAHLLENYFAHEGKGSDTGKVFLTVWDKDTRKLRTIVPLDVYKASKSPFVYVEKGSSYNGKTIVTIRAWDPDSWRPIDAMVCLDDTWYQLENGQATAWIDRESPYGVLLFARYPGMRPKEKVVSE